MKFLMMLLMTTSIYANCLGAWNSLITQDKAQFTTRKWQELGERLNLSESITKKYYIELLQRFNGPDRAYHNFGHIIDLYENYNFLRDGIDMDSVELAIWFHDAIYIPRSATNEEDSEIFFREFAKEVGLAEALTEEVSQIILATKSHQDPGFESGRFFLDLDLSILGADKDKFEAFEQGVREEYAFAPSFIYRYKRKQILESFLSRDQLYFTEKARAYYQKQAWENLLGQIKKLSFF